MEIKPDTFAELTDIDDGDFQRRIDAKTAEVMEGVTMHAMPGSVTITFQVLPTFRDGQMGVTFAKARVTGKKPEPVSGTSFRYIRKDGTLSKLNPGQTVLPFHTIPNDSEVRVVNAESADVRSV